MHGRAFVLVAFGAGVWIGHPRLPTPLDDGARDARFSAARAMDHVRAWARAPRPSGSPAHAAVVAGVEGALTDVGLVVTRETFGERRRRVNLVAQAPGATAPGGGVWLVAHSDSVSASPGAADDGLGLAVLVEAARALGADAGPPAGLHVLVTDAEEEGLLGAQAHVAALAPDAPARVVLNVEARGTEGPVYMFQTAGPPGPILTAWRDSGCDAYASSLARVVYDALPSDTDFTVFRRAGWWGYDFALIHGAWRYHTPADTPENLDARSVQQMGDCVVGLARAWLDADVEPSPVPSSDAAQPAYTPAFGRTWVIPGALVRLVAATTLLGIGVGLRDGERPLRALAFGAAAWLAAGLAAGAGGVALLAVSPRLRADFWTNPAEVDDPFPFWALAAGLAVVSGLAALRLARRWEPEAARGWHATAGALGALVALALPTVGYVLLPGAQASAALLRGRAALAAPMALLAGVLLGPLLHALYPALTTRGAPVLAVAPLLVLAWLARVEGPAPRRPVAPPSAEATPSGSASAPPTR